MLIQIIKQQSADSVLINDVECANLTPAQMFIHQVELATESLVRDCSGRNVIKRGGFTPASLSATPKVLRPVQIFCPTMTMFWAIFSAQHVIIFVFTNHFAFLLVKCAMAAKKDQE